MIHRPPPARPRRFPRPSSLAVTLPLAAVLVLTASIPAEAQGIPFVTRRTPTVRKQIPARQFFDAAGLSVAGAGTNTVAGTPVAPGPALATSPSGARSTARPTPPASTSLARTPSPVRLPPPGPARGYLVPPSPTALPRVPTNSPTFRP